MSVHFTDVPLAGPVAQVFPALTDAQIARVEMHGRHRALTRGEVLIEQGGVADRIWVILTAEIEIVRPAEPDKAIVTLSGRGVFSGEINSLSGRSALLRVQVAKSGEVIELDRHELMALVQTDAEIGEIVMRAYILRRAGFISGGVGDVVLIGSDHSGDTLRLKEFLVRNGHPYRYLDAERDDEVEQLMAAFKVSVDDVPVVVCRGETVLRNPSNRTVAECLGFNESIDRTHLRDVVVVGAGPSGLAAAVYGASEGLDVLVVESTAPGGQAGSSSRIENYLGFPTGVSGNELAARAIMQAEKFGAEMLVDRVLRLKCDRRPYRLQLESGDEIQARTIVIASGAQYRKPPLENLARFENNGIYYGATFVESQGCAAQEVIVVGGGNSAGQAAVFLSQTASKVYVLVRADGLAASMSRYLSRRIEETPNIELRVHTEIVELGGDESLSSVRLKNAQTGAEEERPIRHVFMMMGAVPNTVWLGGCVVLEESGFVKTGASLSPEDLVTAGWPLQRPPYLLETSLPGVFAVGDVRSGSVKRAATAVGEGANAVAAVHQVLA